ncbi:peroxiredoxin [Phormidium willei BDU 130791]|nr:peroxiredoxin [Phormidium willei BDU 130791]
MPTRSANATWTGGLKGGKGHVESQSGAVDTDYSFPTRFEDQPGSNPEELIGAAHAGCYAMAFSALLEQKGFPPDRIDAKAAVTLGEVDGKPTLTGVALSVTGKVPGLDAETFEQVAEEAKGFCPVSRALAGTEITLESAALAE